MAGEITHIVYGKKIFDRNKLTDWPKFLVGTIFPDIRYVANIDRGLLHDCNTSEALIPRINAFESGKYVHSLVDEKRDLFINSRNVYNFLPHQKSFSAALKLYEDALTYELFSGWQEVIDALDSTYEEAFVYGVNEKTVKKWHNFFKKYFKKKPDEKQWLELGNFLGFNYSDYTDLMKAIKIIKSKPEVLAIIKGTYKNI